MLDRNKKPSDSLIPSRPRHPESLTKPGDGLDRYTLLHGETVRSRVLTQADDGDRKTFVIVGGDDTSDGHMPGPRPPLVIQAEIFGESDGKQGIAVLPYEAQTLRDTNGVFIGEEFKLGGSDSPRTFGKVIQIDHVPDVLPNQEVAPAELAVQRLFEPYEEAIGQIARTYNDAANGVTPPDILP